MNRDDAFRWTLYALDAIRKSNDDDARRLLKWAADSMKEGV